MNYSIQVNNKKQGRTL